MKSSKVILYDDNCPLCCWYTNAFVQAGLLPEDGRQPFAKLQANDYPQQQLNLERSKDEIPLLDTAGGPTLYGIDSLLYILDQRWPRLTNIARWVPVNWFIRRLYKLVSYNRRIIVAGETPAGSFDCSPHFNFFYRYLYLGLALLLGGMGSAYFIWQNQLGSWAWLTLSGLTLLPSVPGWLRLAGKARLQYWGIMFTPYLLLGLLLLSSTLLGVPALAGGSLALVFCLRMWFRRWAVAA